MRKLVDFLECEDEIGRDTDEYDVARTLTDIIYDEFPILYYSYHNEDAIMENFDIEMDSEYMDEYHSSYYYHLHISDKMEQLFIDHYPEKVI